LDGEPFPRLSVTNTNPDKPRITNTAPTIIRSRVWIEGAAAVDVELEVVVTAEVSDVVVGVVWVADTITLNANDPLLPAWVESPL